MPPGSRTHSTARPRLQLWLWVFLITATCFFTTSVVHAAPITLSGTLYTDAGTTEYTTAGTVISLKVDGAGTYSTTTVAGTGAWRIDNVTATPGDTLTLWVDNDPTFRASVVTIANTGNITDLDLYQDHVIVRQEGSTDVTLDTLATYDSSDDADIRYTAATTTDELTVHDAQTLYIWSGTTFTAPATTTLTGSYTNNGTFASDNGTVYFDKIGYSATLAGDMTGSNAFHEVQVTTSPDGAFPIPLTSASYGGNIWTSVVHEGYLYVGGETTNAIRRYNLLDITEAPVTSVTFGAPIYALAIHNGYIYAGGGITAFRRYDLANFTAAPVLSANYGGAIVDFAISGDYIYVGGTTGTFKRYTLSNITATPLESASYGGTIWSLAVAGDYIYVGGETTNAVRRYALADITAAPLQSATAGGRIISLAIAGDYIYAGGDTNFAIKRYALSDITLTPLTSASYNGTILSLIIDGDYLYAGGAGGSVKRYALSDITIAPIASIDYGSPIKTLAIAGDYIYAGGDTVNAIRRFNLSDLEHIGAPLTSAGYGGEVYALAIDGRYLYVGGDVTNAVRRYDLLDFTAAPVTSASFGAIIYSLAIHEGYLYVGGGWTSFARYDLANFTAAPSWSAASGGAIVDFAFHGDHVYVGGTSGDIKRYALSDIATAPVASAPYGGTIWGLGIDGDYIYAGGQTTNAVLRYTLSDITATPLTGASYGGEIYTLTISDGYLYAGGSAGPVKRYTLSDITATPLSSPHYGGAVTALTVHDGYVYAGGSNNFRVKRYKVSDLTAAPQESAKYGGWINDFAIHDGYLYAGGQTTNAVSRYDLTTRIIATDDVEFGAPLSIHTSSTLSAGLTPTATTTLTLGGDFTNHGTFAPQQSTVLLSGAEHTLTGTTTFHNLTKQATGAATTTFEAGAQFTVTGTWTMSGTETHPHALRSTADGSYWYVDPRGARTLAYLDVKDSYNTNVTVIDCDTGCIDSGNNVEWVFGIVGSTTIATHDAGQIRNAFSFQNKTDEPLYAFKLTPESGTTTIEQLTFTLSGAQRLDPTRFSNIRLLRDVTNDAEYDSESDEIIGGPGTLTLDGQHGTLTFSEPFTVSTVENYIVIADWDHPDNGAMLTITLETSGVLAIRNGVQDIFGTVPSIQHIRMFSGGGGSVGTAAPPGREVITGGTPGGGEQIGETPGFRWPTAHSGDWQDAHQAYDQTDDTYATSDTPEETVDFFDHGFSIREANEITGIAIKLEVSGSDPGGTIGVQLSGDGGVTWSTIKLTPTLTELDAVVTLGGQGATWGYSWSPSSFTNENFRVRLIANPAANTVRVDELQAYIYHQTTEGGPGGGAPI